MLVCPSIVTRRYIRDLNICGNIRYILIARIRYIATVLKGGANVRIIFDITK